MNISEEEKQQIISDTFDKFSEICNEIIEELEDDLSSIGKKIHLSLNNKLQLNGLPINEQVKAFTISAIMMSIFDM